MRIAVMGSGGMGGYFGAKLAAAGEDVTFIARGEHLAAMRQGGLRLRGAEAIHVHPVNATADPREPGVVDVVLFCVKLYDTESAAGAIRPLVGPDTVVLTVQNGIESAARIGEIIGDEHLLSGAAYFPANITAPGEVTYLGKIQGKPHVVFGEPGAGESTRARALAATFEKAGIVTQVSTDTEVMLWEKFCLMVGGSATMALTRQNIGTVRSDPHMRWLLTEAIAETAAVGRARNVALAPDTEARTLAALEGNPATAKASLLVDLERGRRLELEGLSGAVVRLAAELGVDTPVHRTVYAGLKPFVNGAP